MAESDRSYVYDGKRWRKSFTPTKADWLFGLVCAIAAATIIQIILLVLICTDR